MLLTGATRVFEMEGIWVRQGVQPPGTIAMLTLPVNVLMQHLANPVNLNFVVQEIAYARRAVPGDIHIIPEGTQIQFDFTAATELLVFGFDRQRLRFVSPDLGQSGDPSLKFNFSRRDPQLSSLVHALQQELQSGCARGESYMKYLSSTVIRYVTSTFSAYPQAPASQLPGLPPNRLRFILDHIHSNIHSRLFSADLAKLVQMSPQHFANLFRQSTGRAPHEYILRHRIEQGKRLLAETRKPIVEIAIEVGFAHQSHFGDAFRQFIGMTPKRYRQLHESFGSLAGAHKVDRYKAA